MMRLEVSPRPDWRQEAEQDGFSFYEEDGELYWDESVCYSFTPDEIEKGLMEPAKELHQMCLDLVSEVVLSEELMTKLAIPPMAWELVKDSWQRNEPRLYGRLDFSFDGHGPAKLYEYNADTPTTIFESAHFQKKWFKDAMAQEIIPKSAKDFNTIEEKLVEVFKSFSVQGPMHFACVEAAEEDLVATKYLANLAKKAGIETKNIFMEDIGADEQGLFIDMENQPIHWLYKLYPWEYLINDPYGELVENCDTNFIEPPWKMILSNKGILPLLWERHEGHPNLLPAWFHDIAGKPLVPDFVVKPLFSREGDNIYVFQDYTQTFSTDGDYGAEGYIGQALCPPPFIDGNGPSCGVWVVGDEACGLGIREDKSPITGYDARFVPYIVKE